MYHHKLDRTWAGPSVITMQTWASQWTVRCQVLTDRESTQHRSACTPRPLIPYSTYLVTCISGLGRVIGSWSHNRMGVLSARPHNQQSCPQSIHITNLRLPAAFPRMSLLQGGCHRGTNTVESEHRPALHLPAYARRSCQLTDR